jgi:hypothetical protein
MKELFKNWVVGGCIVAVYLFVLAVTVGAIAGALVEAAK